MGYFSRKIIQEVVDTITSNYQFELIRDSPIIFHEAIYECSISDEAYFEDFESITELMDPDDWSTSTQGLTQEIIASWKKEVKECLFNFMSQNQPKITFSLYDGIINIRSIVSGVVSERSNTDTLSEGRDK